MYLLWHRSEWLSLDIFIFFYPSFFFFFLLHALKRSDVPARAFLGKPRHFVAGVEWAFIGYQYLKVGLFGIDSQGVAPQPSVQFLPSASIDILSTIMIDLRKSFKPELLLLTPSRSVCLRMYVW
jgi:hypothetical protein